MENILVKPQNSDLDGNDSYSDYFIYSTLKNIGEKGDVISFEPYFRSMNRHSDLTIEARKIELKEWIKLKDLIENSSPIDFTETLSFKISDFMDKDELNNFIVPDCNAGPYVSPTSKVKGHVYSVNADVTGTQLGAISYNVFFFHIHELDSYIAITEAYLCV